MPQKSIFLLFGLLSFFFGFTQNNYIKREIPTLYFSGLKDTLITKSQLFDSTTKLICNITIPDGIHSKIYLSGQGFINIMTIDLLVNKRIGFLHSFKNKITTNSIICIDGTAFYDKKKRKNIYVEGVCYRITGD
jgi:hypothetical protein